jgi:hypothetical protein
MLAESVNPLGTMQHGQDQGRCALHATPSLRGMNISQVQRDNEAGIGVNAQ